MHFWLVAIPAPHAIRIEGYIFVGIKFEPLKIQVALLVLTISGIPMPQVKDAAFDAAERTASVREEWICPGAVMLALVSYYRKLWIRCGDEKGGVPFRVDHANSGGSRVEGDATDAEGSGQWGRKGSRRATF